MRGHLLSVFLQQIHGQQHHCRDHDIHQHPAHGTGFVVGAPQLVHGGGNGGGLAGGCSLRSCWWHRTRPARGQRPAPCLPECPDGSRASAPARRSTRPTGPAFAPTMPAFRQSFQTRRARAVHQRKGHHDGCKDGTVPVHDQLHAEMLAMKKGTQRPLCAEQKQ